MKKKISKKEFEKLPELFQAEYTEGDNGEYSLTIEGDEDLGALRRAKEHEASKRKEEAKKRRDLEKELEEYKNREEASKEHTAKKTGDIEALETSYKAKIKKLEEAKNQEIEKYKGSLSNILVDSVAESLAKDISKVPKLLAPIIKQRLKADFDGDSPTTRILDSNGQISALSLDELKAEYQNDPELADVMIASKASGGVKSSGLSNGTGLPVGGSAEPPKKLSDMTDQELMAHISSKREESET